MQAALRLARHQAHPLRRSARCLATTANPAHVVGSTASSSTAKATIIPLSNVEAQWAKLSSEEKLTVHEQLEELQKKDWKELSIDEKKAAYYVAFGPHGPRAPTSQPGDALKIFLGTMGLCGVALGVFLGIRSLAPPNPKTLSKEWEEATNVIALEKKMNPISGISSEYSDGKGFVQSK